MFRPLGVARRELWRAAAALGGLLLLAELGLWAASFACGPITFDVGPSTGAYTAGFRESEERLPTTFRWSRGPASVELPLTTTSGHATLAIRAARFVDHPTRVDLRLSGNSAGSFTAKPGGYRIRRFPVAIGSGPLSVEIRSDDPELGLAVDWLRIEGARARIPVSVWQPRALVVGVFLASLLGGFGLGGAAVIAAALGLLQAAWAAVDPFGLVHVARHLGAPACLMAVAAAALLRRWPAGRWVLLIFLAGYLLKGAGLFHPSYFYPDVRVKQRYVAALAQGTGTLPQRDQAARTALSMQTRDLGGQSYTFPYSPVFYLPFTLLANADAAVSSMKHVALGAAAVEVLVVFALAGRVLGPSYALTAAFVAACLPVLFFRLLFAMYSTVAGHLLDMLVITGCFLLLERPRSPGRLAVVAILVQVALLSYVSSLFTVTFFVLALAALDRALAPRLLVVWGLAAGVTLAFLYGNFVLVFAKEILPTVLATGGARSGPGTGPVEGFQDALWRIVAYLGYPAPLLAVPGAVLLWRRAPPGPRRVLLAYALSFAALLALRGLSGGLFKNLKEILFAAPLVATAAGASLAVLAEGGGGRRCAAWLAAGVTLVLSLLMWRERFLAHSALVGL